MFKASQLRREGYYYPSWFIFYTLFYSTNCAWNGGRRLQLFYEVIQRLINYSCILSGDQNGQKLIWCSKNWTRPYNCKIVKYLSHRAQQGYIWVYLEIVHACLPYLPYITLHGRAFTSVQRITEELQVNRVARKSLASVSSKNPALSTGSSASWKDSPFTF